MAVRDLDVNVQLQQAAVQAGKYMGGGRQYKYSQGVGSTAVVWGR